MGLQTNDQLLHDRINLVRLVRRLDKAVEDPDWAKDASVDARTRAKGLVQKMKYAKKLLQNVSVYDGMDENSKHRAQHEDIRKTLDRVESAVLALDERLTLPVARPKPILPTIPLPPPAARGLAPPPATPGVTAETADAPIQAEVDLLLGGTADTAGSQPGHSDPFDTSLIVSQSKPAADTSSGAASAPAPAFLQNSAAVQDELSAQLAQMARQLKANATYFSAALERDKSAVAAADTKLGANLDEMRRERVRLRDHRGKSMGTTCLTVTSVAVVLVAFVLMFFIIRFTRR